MSYKGKRTYQPSKMRRTRKFDFALVWPRKVDVLFLQEEEPQADISSLLVMRKSLTKSEIVRNRPEIDRIFKREKLFPAKV